MIYIIRTIYLEIHKTFIFIPAFRWHRMCGPCTRLHFCCFSFVRGGRPRSHAITCFTKYVAACHRNQLISISASIKLLKAQGKVIGPIKTKWLDHSLVPIYYFKHMPRHLLRHVPKQVPDRHVPEHMPRHMLLMDSGV